MRQHTTESDGGTDESVQFLVTADGELKVAGRDTLDLEILGRVLVPCRMLATELTSRGRTRARPTAQAGCMAEVATTREDGQRGGKRLTPASSRTSAVRYSSTAVTYTAALAPTRILF